MLTRIADINRRNLVKWKNKGKELEGFIQNWQNVNKFSVFGFGQKCKNFIEAIHTDFKIINFYDNDLSKSGEIFYGAKVFSAGKINQKANDEKILISTHYQEISEQLSKMGLIEDIDFCDINKFLCSWYWYNKQEVHIPEVHIALTTKCSLNCKNCNMFIPYHKENYHNNINDLKKDTRLFFDLTDKVYLFSVLGGEPFLYPDLYEYLLFLCDNYRDKITELRIVTNGTVVPSTKIMKLIKKYQIVVNISDYSNLLQFKTKFESTESTLRNENLNVTKSTSSSTWLDFGFPHAPLCLPEEKLINHMHQCSPVFRGINDGKFYYCHIIWSAVKSGLLKEDACDSLDMSLLNASNPGDKIKLIEYNLGYMEKGYVSLCKLCGGCGSDNKAYVEAALQDRKF